MEKREYTPDDIWAMLAETDRLQKENAAGMQEIRNIQKETSLQMKETDKLIKELRESGKETDRRMEETDRRMEETDRLQKENAAGIKELRESQKETDRLIKETALQMKETDRRMDKRMQKLDEKMGGIDDNLGFHAERFFQDALTKSKIFGGIKYDNIIRNMTCEDETEFDIVLINCESVAIIEVKNRIHPGFVEKMAKDRLDKFRKHLAVYKNHKTYLGIAGFSFCNDVLEKAGEYGIGIIRQIGDSMEMDAGELRAY
jgi:hypothetical protein